MKGLRRFGAITGVLVRHGYGNVIERMFKRSRKKGAETTPETRPAFHSPARIRRMLEELGPSFIKLGQALSTRADLLSAQVADDLAELQDHLPPFPAAIARRIVATELGRPVEEVFENPHG